MQKHGLVLGAVVTVRIGVEVSELMLNDWSSAPSTLCTARVTKNDRTKLKKFGMFGLKNVTAGSA